jgi:hypothetical protein
LFAVGVLQRPVVITGLDNADFRAACGRAALLEHWADASIALSTANTYRCGYV